MSSSSNVDFLGLPLGRLPCALTPFFGGRPRPRFTGGSVAWAGAGCGSTTLWRFGGRGVGSSSGSSAMFLNGCGRRADPGACCCAGRGFVLGGSLIRGDDWAGGSQLLTWLTKSPCSVSSSNPSVKLCDGRTSDSDGDALCLPCAFFDSFGVSLVRPDHPLSSGSTGSVLIESTIWKELSTSVSRSISHRPRSGSMLSSSGYDSFMIVSRSRPPKFNSRAGGSSPSIVDGLGDPRTGAARDGEERCVKYGFFFAGDRKFVLAGERLFGNGICRYFWFFNTVPGPGPGAVIMLATSALLSSSVTTIVRTGRNFHITTPIIVVVYIHSCCAISWR